MKKRIITFAIIFLIAVTILMVFFAQRGKRAEAIHTTGIIEGVEVNLSSKVSGKISEICCNEGDKVEKGQIVIKLESDDLRASVEQARAGVEKAKADVRVSESAIENAKANIQNAEAEIKSSEADVEKARAVMDEAKKKLDRATALYKEELISTDSFEIVTTNYDTSVATYMSAKARLTASYSKRDAATAQLNASISQLNSAKAKLKESEANLSYHISRLYDTVIKTPISGTVIFKSLEESETVSPGVTILTIVDMDNLYVRVDIEETLIGSVALNSETIVRAEGIPDKVFKGKVSEIGRYAEFATQRDVTRGRQDIKTFRVKVKLTDTAEVLKPGMTVEVEIPKKV
ncbi:MAG: efflux RND transporter periplasmic adaptor subunit [Nitrospirota bacterium]